MGYWGAGILDNDTALDLKSEYEDYMKEGFSHNEIVERLVKECSVDEKRDASEFSDFYITVAYIQMEYKSLTPEVREKAFYVINNDPELKMMEDLDFDEAFVEERKRVLREFKKQILKGQKI